MILPKDMNLAWLVSERVTVYKKKKFDGFTELTEFRESPTEKLTESCSNGDYRGDMKTVKAVSLFWYHIPRRLHDNDKVDRTHPVSLILSCISWGSVYVQESCPNRDQHVSQ
jgi:hypothetical protein